MTEALKTIKPWFGFLEDQIFGEIISDKTICKYILETILSFKIKEIYYPKKQKEVKNPKHRKRKEVRFDILVEDYDHNLYDVEAQTTDNKDIGWRMRYYAAKMDQRYTLGKSKTYLNMKKAYLIFLCKYDPKGEGRIKLINNRPVHLNKIFDDTQARIKDINEDPEWRDKMIDYDTRMLEREQEA